jgi:hypothetical protein
MRSREELAELKSLFANADTRVTLYFAENPSIREEHIGGHPVVALEQEASTVYQERINEDRLRQNGFQYLFGRIAGRAHGEVRAPNKEAALPCL